MPDIEVIKWDPVAAGVTSNNEIVAFRYLKQDFGEMAQLQVDPGQIAYFMNEGEPAIFGPGHYTLGDSNNSMYRILNKWRRQWSKGVSSFHCYCIFINAVYFRDLRCASPSPIPIHWKDIDAVALPGTRVAKKTLYLQAAGLLAVHVNNDVEDGKGVLPLVKRVLGGDKTYLTKDELADFLTAQTADEMTSGISEYVNDQGIPVSEITSYRPQIAQAFAAKLKEEFATFGFVLDKFSFVRLDYTPESLKYVQEYEDRMNEIVARQTEETELSKAEAAKRQREGYTYQQERAMDVMQTAAGNEAQIGQMMGLGVGFGVGRGLGPAFGEMANQSMNPAQQQGGMQGQPAPQQAAAPCPNCGSPVPPGTKFCPNCGNKVGNFCPNCGGELAPGAKFCPNCGAKLVKVCSQCGTELAPGAKFCPNCGAKNE